MHGRGSVFASQCWASRCLSLQSLLTVQEGAQTQSPWGSLTQEHARGW